MDDLSSRDYWEDRLKENFGLHGTGFQGLGKRYNEYMYKVRKRVFLHLMKKFDMDFATINVLDIGSGTGFYVGLWEDLGVFNLTGTDITTVAVENLKLMYPSYEFLQLDIGNESSHMTFSNKFDIISAFDVLFHIVDDTRYENAIRNVVSLLKPDGLFIFSENFLHHNSVKSARQVSRSLDIIQKVLSENNLEVLLRRPMFVLMNAPVDTNKSLLKGIWRTIVSTVRRGEISAYIACNILYPIELFLVSVIKESPSTEIMICKSANSKSD
jgi:SAM-dependent methyltransferase